MLVTIATIGIVLTVSGVALLLMDWLLERRGIPSRISMLAMYPVLACAFLGGFAQLEGKPYDVWLFALSLFLAFAGPLLAGGWYSVRRGETN
jgi:preprotein translocase subunit SecY